MPYFTKRRFPDYWPVTEALKQYLKNHRKRVTRVKKNSEKQQLSQSDDEDENLAGDGDQTDGTDGENDDEEEDGQENEQEQVAE
jgi:hypothetical protein